MTNSRLFSAALSLVLVLPMVSLPAVARRPEPCAQILSEGMRISRQQLAELLTVRVGSSANGIMLILGTPYCRLQHGDAYPFDHDPSTWLIIYYEGDRYAGYDFTYNNPLY